MATYIQNLSYTKTEWYAFTLTMFVSVSIYMYTDAVKLKNNVLKDV